MAKLLETFTAPGNSEILSNTAERLGHIFSAVVTNIDTNVVIRIEGSFNKVDWDNIDEEDYTITANDTYNFILEPLVQYEHLRFVFVSEAGGTAAEIKVWYRGRI